MLWGVWLVPNSVCVSVCAVCSCQAQTLQRGKYLIYMYFLEEKCNISSAGKQVWRKIPRSQMELTRILRGSYLQYNHAEMETDTNQEILFLYGSSCSMEVFPSTSTEAEFMNVQFR